MSIIADSMVVVGSIGGLIVLGIAVWKVAL